MTEEETDARPHVAASQADRSLRGVCELVFDVRPEQPRADYHQATIQTAIDAAGNGDTVLVAPGIYIENISFLGKNITVTSSGGPSATTIDGGGNGSVVTFTGGETNSAVLSGFTIQNGSTYYAAGGVQVTNASPTITGNVITGNHAPSGLGVYINGGSPVIKNNTITGNTQIGSSGGGGGGIYASGSNTTPGAPLITGNTITNNSVANGGNGGGILADYFSTPTIEDNLIEGNTAYNNGGGVAIRTYGASIVVQNIIVNNSSGGGGSGAGVYVFASSETPADNFANNTIANNAAYDHSSGVFVGGFAQMIVFANNVVVSASGENSVTCDATYSPISAKFSHNDAFSLSGAAWTGVCDTTTYPGNISLDPQFVNASNGDFHLRGTSPVIDSGDNGAANLPQSDYDGNPRILDGKNACVNTVDLGAYEVVKTIAANLSPASLVFGSQVVGTTSTAQAVTFASTGQTCFQYSGPQISGDFIQNNTCPSAGLPGGSSCAFSVSFAPIATGTRTGSLMVNGTNGTNLAVSLNGNGTSPPIASVSPGTLAFPNQVIGTASSPIPVTVTNTGGGTLTIQSVSVTGVAFSQTNNCSAGLTAGAACTVSLVFAPTAVSGQAGTLSISDNASGSPQPVGLSGTGVDFSISASPSSVSVGKADSAKVTLTLNSVGGAFGHSVVLSCAGLPAQSSCSFSPAGPVPGSTSATSVMTITTHTSTPTGTFIVTVTGQLAPVEHSAQISLTVRKH